MAMARRKAPRAAKATPAKKVEKRLLEQEVKNLERALKEERTGLVAVARIVIEECPDSRRLLRRLEAMARKAEEQRAPARTRDAIRHGHAQLARALEQVQGRAQGLFDPHVGHVQPSKVEALTEPVEAQQIGFGFTERDPLSDVQERDQERAAGERAIREMIVTCFKDCGALTDGQLEAEYRRRATPLKLGTLKAQRKELTRLGRLAQGDLAGDTPTWNLVEAGLITEGEGTSK
jgi:hypothetical protein